MNDCNQERATHVFLEGVDEEFEEEASVVARVQAVPHSKEHQGREDGNVAVVHEFEALVNVPKIGGA